MKVSFVGKGSGGIISHDMVDLPSDFSRWDASPAPTVTLFAPGGGTIVASATASTVDATTLASAAPAATNDIALATTAGVLRWEPYVVGPNAAGQAEWCILDAVASATGVVTTLDPLRYSYASSQAFKTHRLKTTITATDAGSLVANARAEWGYEVDDVARKESTIFNISLYAPRLGLTSSDVLSIEPRVRKVIGSNQRIDYLLRHLWESRVLPDIAKIFNPGALVSGAEADEALLFLVQQYMARKSKELELAEEYGRLYGDALDELRNSMIDLDQSGAQGEDEVVRGINTPRMMRG